jgi:hypothetical protein
MKAETRLTLAACTGLVAAPLLWVVNMQASQILPYLDCGKLVRSTALLPLFSLLVVLGSGWISWRARSSLSEDNTSTRPKRFVAALGGFSALIFAFALLLQAMAGVALTGCER